MKTIVKEYALNSGVKVEVTEVRGAAMEQEIVWLDGHECPTQKFKATKESQIKVTLKDGQVFSAQLLNREGAYRKVAQVPEEMKTCWYLWLGTRAMYIANADERAAVLEMIDSASAEAEADESWQEYQRGKAEAARLREERDKRDREFRRLRDLNNGEQTY